MESSFFTTIVIMEDFAWKINFKSMKAVHFRKLSGKRVIGLAMAELLLQKSNEA
jgi:hypothetical protein